MIHFNAMKLAASCGLAISLSISAQLSQAGNALGLSYASGFDDVANWHEDNLYVDRSGLGLGLSYRYIHEFDPNLRMDVGASYYGMWGDVDYSDLPLQLTIGYNFAPSTTFNPYIRGGLSYHIMDGDYVEKDADVGFLGAIGVEIGSGVSFFMEVSMDTAEATFNTNEGSWYYTRRVSQEDLKISDVVFTLGARF